MATPRRNLLYMHELPFSLCLLTLFHFNSSQCWSFFTTISEPNTCMPTPPWPLCFSSRGSRFGVSGLLSRLPLPKQSTVHHSFCSRGCLQFDMSPPRYDESQDVNTRMRSLHNLVMSNLPRVAALEYWKKDVTFEIGSTRRWQKDRWNYFASLEMRINAIEQHLGIGEPRLCNLDLEDPFFAAASESTTGSQMLLPEPSTPSRTSQ